MTHIATTTSMHTQKTDETVTHTPTSIPRKVKGIVTAHRQSEGGGFIVRRPIPSHTLDSLDPFLLLDEMGPVNYAPGEAIGAPDHPHRGFETVTYLLEGEMQHKDSAGHQGMLKPGDVQWMTAGSGIIHSEMPSRAMLDKGGPMHGFQIWINLPSRLKMTTPRYQEVAQAQIPTATSQDGKAQVNVVAGQAFGVEAIIETHTPIVYHDWTVQPGGQVSIDIRPDHNVGVYVFSGKLLIGQNEQNVEDGQLAILSEGVTIQFGVSAHEHTPARFLVLGGIPHNEPVARYGPFVMNTKEELQQAFADYRSGRMGKIHASFNNIQYL